MFVTCILWIVLKNVYTYMYVSDIEATAIYT